METKPSDTPTQDDDSDGNKNQNCATSNSGFFKKILCDLSKTSVTTRLAIGGLSGWCTGYLFFRVGKLFAVALVGSLFAFMFAQQQNYIRINWNKVKENAKEAKKTWKKRSKQKGARRGFVRENAILVTGFTGGLLIGLFSA